MEPFVTHAIHCRFRAQCLGCRLQDSCADIGIGILGCRYQQYFYDCPHARSLQCSFARVPCTIV